MNVPSQSCKRVSRVITWDTLQTTRCLSLSMSCKDPYDTCCYHHTSYNTSYHLQARKWNSHINIPVPCKCLLFLLLANFLSFPASTGDMFSLCLCWHKKTGKKKCVLWNMSLGFIRASVRAVTLDRVEFIHLFHLWVKQTHFIHKLKEPRKKTREKGRGMNRRWRENLKETTWPGLLGI